MRKIAQSFQRHLPGTTVVLFFILLFVLPLCSASSSLENEGEVALVNGRRRQEEEEEEVEPVDAILFPFFVLALGIISFRLLSRYAEWLPYTGFMFVLGTCIGVGVTRVSGSSNLLNESILNFWLPIDSEVFLVSFLPGLIYHDASSQNTHLFRVAFAQCAIFAFPMVLAGTVLTALVAYHIFPYDWSFNLAMTFGSILSATDPVAVAALLDQVGAPPRLKVHIAGESLLNDGSAIVFFNIFSGLYLLELDVEGLGTEVDWAEGIKLFFRKSVGGACIGVFFGLGLLTILHLLHRRLDREENVVQVGSTFSLAYLCYFTADVAWETSGVMAVVAMGVLTSAFGQTLTNDPKLMADFWSTVEWLLNTVLFALGGLVWGSIIGNQDEDFPEREFTGRDWGYLFLLYILLTVIRFGLYTAAYPVVSRIGLGSSWKELIFESYGGLRGAVGISLAIFLDNIVKANANSSDTKFVLQSNKLFGFVGGIAFLTLMINGVMAGPLLRYLGLADTSDTRKRMLNCFLERNRQNAIRDFVDLLGQGRFRKVSFAVIRYHVPFLKDLTRAEVIEAANMAFSVKEANETIENDDVIHLDGVLAYLNKLDVGDDEDPTRRSSSIFVAGDKSESVEDLTGTRYVEPTGIPGAMHVGSGAMSLTELRRLFLELVRAGYRKQIDDGELVDREFVYLALIESLELAAESVERADRLNDWDYVFLVRYPSVDLVRFAHSEIGKYLGCNSLVRCFGLARVVDADTIRIRLDTEKCLAFILAHTTAQATIKEYFMNDRHFELVEGKIIEESQAQVAMAEAHMQQFDKGDVEVAVSHKVCKILLNNSVKYIQSLVEKGMVKEQEAAEFFEEIQRSLFRIDSCDMKEHPGEKRFGGTEHDVRTLQDMEIDDDKCVTCPRY